MHYMTELIPLDISQFNLRINVISKYQEVCAANSIIPVRLSFDADEFMFCASFLLRNLQFFIHFISFLLI